MAMIGVRIAALGLALAVFCPSLQAGAFGLRLGSFLLGWRAHHHHRHLVRRPTEALHSEATPTDVAQNRAVHMAGLDLEFAPLLFFGQRIAVPRGSNDRGPLHLGGSSPAGLRLSCAHAALVSRPVDLPQRQSESVCPASATQTLRSAPSCCFTTRTSLPAGSWMQPAGKPFRFSSIDIL